jgi:hypothetical protein
VRSILRFMFVVVPTAALATAVVVGVSRSGGGGATSSDGDLQRDLKLASSTTLELAPLGQSLMTVSAIEAPPAATPERTVRPRRSSSGSRVIRSRTPVVRAAPEPDVAESTEESHTTQVTELAGASAEATTVAPADGGVALPRPTAIPVSYPGTGSAGGGEATDGGWGGMGTVIRGGGVDGDHCQIHGRGPYGRPVYRQPRGGGIAERVGRSVPTTSQPRSGSIGSRAGAVRGRSSSQGTRSPSRGSIAGRVAAVRGR